jgi:hypothetical protein
MLPLQPTAAPIIQGVPAPGPAPSLGGLPLQPTGSPILQGALPPAPAPAPSGVKIPLQPTAAPILAGDGNTVIIGPVPVPDALERLKSAYLLVSALDPLLQAEIAAARTGEMLSALENAADAIVEVERQLRFARRSLRPWKLSTAGDKRSWKGKTLLLASDVRFIGGRRALVRGTAYNPATDRTNLTLIVEMG